MSKKKICIFGNQGYFTKKLGQYLTVNFQSLKTLFIMDYELRNFHNIILDNKKDIIFPEV